MNGLGTLRSHDDGDIPIDKISVIHKEAVLLDLLRVISHHRARLATPIRTMQKVYTDADMENIPVAETIFTHPAASTTRPLFLVEPSTRINSEDKAKARPTSHANNEQATKTSPTSELKAVPSSEAPGQNNLNMQHQKENSEVTGPSVTSGGEKPSLSEAVSESDRPPSPSPSPPVSRPAFEDNIVLGVALEGSKRMLPIEEGMDTMSATGEASELGVGRNGTSSSPSSTDRKGQRSAPPGAATEQRDKERKGQRSAAPGAATEQRDKER